MREKAEAAFDRLDLWQSDVNTLLVEVDRLRRIEKDYERLKAQYMELLQGSIQHNENMLGGLLQLAMVPGVTDAINRNQAGGGRHA